MFIILTSNEDVLLCINTDHICTMTEMPDKKEWTGINMTHPRLDTFIVKESIREIYDIIELKRKES